MTARRDPWRPEGWEDDEFVAVDEAALADPHGDRCRCRFCDPDDARDRAAELAEGS